MAGKPLVDRLYERLTGARVCRSPDRGQDLFHDVARSLPRTPITCIFDVGANVGQSAVRYRARFPHADLYCFEPVSSAFEALQRQLGATRAHLYRLALTSRNGTGAMRLNPVSTMHSLAAGHEEDAEPVRMQTLDDFCGENGVARISLLKIDTEGHDLEVLKGARGLLEDGRVDVIEVEAGMNPANGWHVPFERMKSHLEAAGYALFALYEQKREWPTGQPHLRRTNPVFISRGVIESNTA